MSSSRQGTRLMAYSESPDRNRVRVMVTSENSIGNKPALLSIVRDTSARPSAARLGVPAKMTSSILADRRLRGPWAPSTHATASTTLDLPLPFGPTTTVTPGSKSRMVVSANDLNPLIVRDLRNTVQPNYWDATPSLNDASSRRHFGGCAEAGRLRSGPEPAAGIHPQVYPILLRSDSGGRRSCFSHWP